MNENFDMLSPNTPLIYSDGTKLYDKLAENYHTHQKGLFILAPSGAGKTHFVENFGNNHWIDGDILWQASHAHPDGAWWLEDLETIQAIDSRCDVITQEAKKLGFWIVGASNSWLKPDAIVIPDWETHKSWIKHRETHNYDGGATSDGLEQVKTHIEWIEQWESKGVPKFTTVQEAANALAD